MLTNLQVLARDGGNSGFIKPIYSSGRAGIKGWIYLHRPDGEVGYFNTNQMVFVMSGTKTDADKRAHSKTNGSFNARESVEEVMQAVQNDDSLARYGTGLEPGLDKRCRTRLFPRQIVRAKAGPPSNNWLLHYKVCRKPLPLRMPKISCSTFS